MRNALITFFASALGVIVVLFGYQAWQQREAELERDAVERTQREAVLRGQSLQDQVAAEQRAIEAIRNDIVAISSVKVAITEHYMSIGRMPLTNAEAGLPEPAEYRGRSLRSLSIGDDGRIVLEFDGLWGHDGGIIEFVPDLGGTEAMGVQWHCATSDYPQIMRALPSCDYAGVPDTSVPLPRPAG